MDRFVRLALLAGVAALIGSLLAPAAHAQMTRRAAPPPEVDDADTLTPRQTQQPAPPRSARPTPVAQLTPPASADAPPEQSPKRRTTTSAAPPAQPDKTTATAPAKSAPSPAARSVACSGPFVRESSHLKLAMTFDSRNVEYIEVDGPEGSKLMASVIFPKDPKRRLEVLWQNEAARADTALIVIGGQSQWAGPKGLRLGLALAAIEKLNGKPFKLSGYDQDNGGSVIDWNGGALAVLPGDCKVSVRFARDSKASEQALDAAMGKEFVSSDAAMRAVKPTVAEIIVGYPQ